MLANFDAILHFQCGPPGHDEDRMWLPGQNEKPNPKPRTSFEGILQDTMDTICISDSGEVDKGPGF
jgi:hypothetical protein